MRKARAQAQLTAAGKQRRTKAHKAHLGAGTVVGNFWIFGQVAREYRCFRLAVEKACADLLTLFGNADDAGKLLPSLLHGCFTRGTDGGKGRNIDPGASEFSLRRSILDDRCENRFQRVVRTMVKLIGLSGSKQDPDDPAAQDLARPGIGALPVDGQDRSERRLQ